MLVEVIAISLFLSVAVAFPFPFETFMFGCRFPNGDHLPNATDENGYEWNQDFVPNNYLIRFHCSPGYMIRGQKTVLCSNGQWASEFPTCVEQFCGPPPKIKNTRHFIYKKGKTNPTIGSIAKYRCTRGFRLANKTDSTLNCTLKEDGVVWDGIMPECIVKETCRDPGVSSDGRREGNCCQVGDKLKFSCNENYEMSGENEIECLEGEVWSTPRPRCRHHNMSYCPDPPEIHNGSIIGYKTGDFYTIDDEASVKCDLGFTPRRGSTYLFCEEDGEWDTDFAKCEEQFCKVPPSLGNGTIPLLEDTNSTEFRFGFQITYQCNPGFRLIGDSMRSCAINGWTGKIPYCEVIRCYDPGQPENGKRSGDNFEIGNKVVFSCFAGYYVIGSAERYCLPNGQWSGELAKCDTETNYCPDPGTPINGWKSGNRYDQGDVVKFGCQPGFYIIGSEIRECQKNQTWTGEVPTCRGPHDFDNVADVAEKLTPISDQEIRFQKYGLNFSSEENGTRARILNLNYAGRIILYFLFDSSGSIEKEHFQTSIEFAKALVRKVGISLNGARAGAMTFSSTANIEFLPMRYDTTEGVLDGLDKIKKSVGGTATRKAFDQLLTEVLPLSQGSFGRENVKSVVFLLTDGKANMAGDPEILAAELKEMGVEIYCIGITGDINQSSLHKIASMPIKEHVFILQNYESLSWLIQFITNGTIDYSQCGLGLRKDPVAAPEEIIENRGRIIGGRQATEPWPWIAALYIDKMLQCGGSIIDRYWILTAAHCLVQGKKVKPLDSVVVKLGLTNIKNTTYLQEFESEEFLIHERFDDKSLDYDIALIKLRSPIHYNTFVRPICLPHTVLPPETTLYKEKENTYAIGWGHNKVLRPNEKVPVKTVTNLKELSLSIRSRNECKESIQGPTVKFTDRMFCAGSGKGREDTCKGDSGGPLMQSQMSVEKNVYWVQVGINSWGEGCGVIGSYAFNTHVSRLRAWITNRTAI